MPVCTEGHEIITGTSHCQHGHTYGAESVNPSSENLMIQLMQQMISLQQENNAFPVGTKRSANVVITLVFGLNVNNQTLTKT